MKTGKALLITCVALLFSGCVINHMSLVRIPSEQQRMLTEIASRRDDGNPPMRIGEINALLITPGGLNPPGKDLFIRFILNIKKTGLKYYLFGGDVTIDVNSCAEKECIRVIDNFRKAGLPPEFTKLCVTADLPEDYRSSNFKTYGERTFCAYVIAREQLMNGSSPRQTFKNFQNIP